MTEEGLTTVMANTQARLTVPMAGECDQQTGLCVQLEGDPETFPDSAPAPGCGAIWEVRLCVPLSRG